MHHNAAPDPQPILRRPRPRPWGVIADNGETTLTAAGFLERYRGLGLGAGCGAAGA